MLVGGFTAEAGGPLAAVLPGPLMFPRAW
jgi:hypothetical protein